MCFAQRQCDTLCNYFITQQESPPAWTQEAYRPRRIKYSICYPVRGEVPPPSLGYPPGQVWWGVPEVGYPCQGTPPSPGLMGVPEVEYPPSGYPSIQVWWGVPPGQVWPGGYPRWGTLPPLGYPPARSDGGYPRWGTPPRLAGSGWDTPPPHRCGLTNKVKLLPSLSYYVRGR